jgi:phosphate:Na+ symporter
VGILQSLCGTGVVTFGSALPIILGQNIGTCITALLGSVGANRNARRTAMVHLLFNVVGVLIFVVIFYGLGLFIDWKFLDNTAAAWDIAVIHTCFNVAATCVLIPLNGLLVKLAYLFIPAEKEPQKMELLDSRLLATPAVAVQRAQEVAGEMAADAAKAMHLAIGLTKKFEPAVMEQIIALEDKTDHYEDALGTYLVKLSAMNLNVHDNRILNTLLYTVSDIERMADHAMAVAKAAEEIEVKKIEFSKQAKGELAVLEQAVLDVIDRTVAAYGSFDLEQAVKIEPQEQVVDALVREVKSRHVRRLRDGLCTVEYGFVLEDLLTACERAADHCSNVAVEMLQVAEGKLEAHEYLNALKAGELHESAAFAERFAQYKAKYAFPDEN